MSLSPFDFLNAINSTKQDLFEDPQAEKDYNPYMVNNGLSYFYDTVLIANELNIYPEIPKRRQFAFLNNSVSKKKRFSKWNKKEASSDDIELVSEFYSCSNSKAIEYLKILNDDQVEEIKKLLEKGGR